jgi:hypothetical protein
MTSWYPVRLVLKTTSPTTVVAAPKAWPWNTVPSAKTKIAVTLILLLFISKLHDHFILRYV